MNEKRESLTALLQDVPDTAGTPAPAVDKDKIRDISEEAGFPSRQAKPKKAKPTKPKLVQPAAGMTAKDLSDEEIEQRISSRRPGRRSEGPKVQFNVRIPNRAFVQIDDLQRETGIPFGTLVERAIDLLEKDMK